MFIKGPIPWSWIHRAILLKGKALHVAMLLWKESGIRGNRTIRLNLSGTVKVGIKIDAARFGWRALASAGLVTIQQYPGQALEVTLLDTPVQPLTVLRNDRESDRVTTRTSGKRKRRESQYHCQEWPSAPQRAG